LFGKKYQGSLDATADKYIGYILTNIDRMQSMVDGLLSFSRVGRKNLVLEEIDTRETCRQAITNLSLVIKEKNAVITVDDLPKVTANYIQMIQLFQNLIGNAIKYCERQPSIHVSAQHDDTQTIYCVSDNGIGIDKQYYDRIFQLFQRLHNKSEYSGTGLGLALCKKIVERYGGHIWLESEPENGTKFYFSLPHRKEASYGRSTDHHIAGRG
jgi:light-regulated signal transduction histidine kinase (bacteriophytochrome)